MDLESRNKEAYKLVLSKGGIVLDLLLVCVPIGDSRGKLIPPVESLVEKYKANCIHHLVIITIVTCMLCFTNKGHKLDPRNG